MSTLSEKLTELTGNSLEWGTLTGVKPLKLYDKLLLKNHDDPTTVRSILNGDYLVSEGKIDLLQRIHEVQSRAMSPPKTGEVSVYIGIPFCPTRCTYCSFTSNQRDYHEIKKYLEALYRELAYVSGEMKRCGLKAETIYVGGGTPTTLEVYDMNVMVNMIVDKIPTAEKFEFTVEAGRPDTITDSKLAALKEGGVGRISINPQTMKESTLGVIGRDHSIEDVREAFEKAKSTGFKAVNTDLIAGLPGEDKEDFEKTLNEIMEYEPENVTIHTLSLKKSSRLMEGFTERGENPLDGTESAVTGMVDHGEKYLSMKGYRPYYIYRQKYMADNLENVGYAKEGTECKYNIRVMEEKQTVIAMGAGGSSKIYFPEEDRLERIMNVSNYEIYIERIDEMIDRKRKSLFSYC